MTQNSEIMQVFAGKYKAAADYNLWKLLFTSVICFIMAALVFVTMILLITNREVNWLALFLVLFNLILMGLPAWEQIYRGAFDPFSPLVLVSLLFGFPTLLLRGVSLALGASSNVLALTPNQAAFLNLSLGCFMIGWVSTMAGYYLPINQRIMRWLFSPKLIAGLSNLRWQSVSIVSCLGMGFTLILIRNGAYGSSLSAFEGNLQQVSVARVFAPWLTMGFYLLVFGATYFQHKKPWRLMAIIVGIILVALGGISGSRAQLFFLVLTIAEAIFYATYPRVKWRQFVPWLLIGIIALAAGLLVSSVYRNILHRSYGENTVTVTQTYNLIVTAMNETGAWSFYEQIQFINERLSERMGSIELLGVTLARADSLKAAEAAVGIDNNIINDAILGLIPRIVWANKPLVGEFGLWFSRLYLDSPFLTYNGPTIFGDLYRNFGWVGVPLGMLFVGIFLRVIYDGLILHTPYRPLSSLIYLKLAETVQWEGTFAGLIPGALRVLVAVFAMVLLLKLINGFMIAKPRTIISYPQPKK